MILKLNFYRGELLCGQRMKALVVGLVIAALITTTVGQIQCVDEDGDTVDWLVMYKLPREHEDRKNRSHNVIKEGKGYAFLTSKDPERGWVISNKSVEEKDSIPGRILSPLYDVDTSKDLLYVIYNDEHPEGNTSFTLGHTKGVLAFGQKTGFWLVHSVPKYPPYPSTGSYGYPSTGERYGQSFLCISISTELTADVIGLQFLFNHPYVYSDNFPSWALGKYPHLELAARQLHIKSPPFFHTSKLTSLAGNDFISFAKFTNFDKDLYADLVSPALQANLMVETWPNGEGRMNSSCQGPFQVENVEEISLSKIDFKTQHDHSKWAVSYNSSKPSPTYVCIGDINRMESQKKRAGGTLCFQQRYVWKAFTGIVKKIDTCGGK